MNQKHYYLLLILLVVGALAVFYSLGQSAYTQEDSDVDYSNLSNLPTSTPRPRIADFVKEALKRKSKPTPPP